MSSRKCEERGPLQGLSNVVNPDENSLVELIQISCPQLYNARSPSQKYLIILKQYQDHSSWASSSEPFSTPYCKYSRVKTEEMWDPPRGACPQGHCALQSPP